MFAKSLGLHPSHGGGRGGGEDANRPSRAPPNDEARQGEGDSEALHCDETCKPAVGEPFVRACLVLEPFELINDPLKFIDGLARERIAAP